MFDNEGLDKKLRIKDRFHDKTIELVLVCEGDKPPSLTQLQAQLRGDMTFRRLSEISDQRGNY